MTKFSTEDVLILTEKIYEQVKIKYVHNIVNKPNYKHRLWKEIKEELRKEPRLLEHHRLAKRMVEKDLWPMSGLEKEKNNLKLFDLLTFH